MKDKRRFRRGSGRYICRACGKHTRETGEGESALQLCRQCQYEAELENEHFDDFHGDGKPHPDCPFCQEETA